MALPHISVATTDEIEFINLEPLDINPLMSKCQIKVMYIGLNDHDMVINKDVCTNMAKTLRGCAIVGCFKEEKGDFTDHGDKIIIDGEGVHFEKETIPYGFVSPDAKVWYQNFQEEDRDTGEIVTRKYLVTEGYLWTHNYEAAKTALENGGRPHSMELEPEMITGEWTKSENSEMEFFIISDGIFSQLCILGEDVEPCFEGSSITPVNKFSLNDNFVKTLSNMMKDLQFALNAKGDSMEETKSTQAAAEEPTPDFTEEKQGESASEINTENENNTEFKKNDSPEEKDDKEEKNGEDSDKKEENEDDKEKKKSDEYSLKIEEMQKTIETMQSEFSKLQKLNSELLAFKQNAENEKKDALISEFYMLSDEDKKDVIANKDNYSLEDIKAKLAVLCFDKKVNFSEGTSDSTESNEETVPAMTFNLGEEAFADSTPDWVKAVKEYQSAKNN